jgi:fatty acid desaturase
MDPRARAMERLKARRRFTRHAAVYGLVIAAFVVIWLLTNRGGYFWPVWPALVWGVALAVHAWMAFGRTPIGEAQIEREMRRDRADR